MYAAVTSVKITSTTTEYRSKKEIEELLKPKKEEKDCCEQCCDRRSKLEKRLIFGVIIAFIILLILLRSYLSVNDEKYCFTDHCTLTASNLLESLDTTKDPCKDFYRYACGGWAKNRLLKGRTADEQFGLTEADLVRDLKDYFEEPADNNETQSVSKMKKLFQLCKNQVDEDIVEAATKIITQKLGEWPFVSTNWQESHTDLMDLLGSANRMGFYNTILSLRIASNPYNTSEKRIIIGQPMRIQNISSVSPLSNDAEWTIIKEVVRSIVFQQNHTEDLSSMAKLHEMIEELKTEEDTFRQTFNKFEVLTIGQLNKRTKKKLDWLRLINKYFEGFEEFNEKQQVVITNLDYIKNLPRIFKDFSKRDLANYIIIFSLTEFVVHYLDDDRELWEVCVDAAHSAFPFAAARLYIEKKNLIDLKYEIEPMVDVIIGELKTLVEENKWMDETTKEAIIEKVDALTIYIGYPSWILNDQELDFQYSDINITDNFLENLLIFREMQFKKSLQEYYGKIINANNFDYRPLDLHVIYFPRLNSFVIPVALFQKPVYVSERIASANFGNLGFLISRELFRSFDHSGLRFDKDGNLHKWWGRDMIELFVNITGCFDYQDQDFCPAINYTEDNRCGSQDVSMEEMAADNSGLKTAFRAYIQWIRKNGKDPNLPGMGNYLPYQIFFLSFANMWCENESDIRDVPEDYGNPTVYRLWSAVANSREFADAFDCWKGPMYRGSDKCSIWGS